jgi:hypothetical protein
LGVNFATKFASTFQCLNYCKQMFIVQVEINNSMESSWCSRLPRRVVFYWIGYYYWVWIFVYKRSSNTEMKLQTLLRCSQQTWEPRIEKWFEIKNKLPISNTQDLERNFIALDLALDSQNVCAGYPDCRT